MKPSLLVEIPAGNRGVAIVELAIILPFLVLMALGIFDYSRAIHAKNILTNMSREGANLASRSSLDAGAAQQIMNSLSYTGQPLAMNANGMMYISVVQGTSQGGAVVPSITNQYRWQNRTVPASRIGTEGSIAQGFGSLNLGNGDAAYVVEVFYRYRGVFFGFLGLDKVMYERSVF